MSDTMCLTRRGVRLAMAAALLSLGARSMEGQVEARAVAQTRVDAGTRSPDTPLTMTTGQHVPHSFARYATPKECEQSIRWNEQAFWRDRRPDTTFYPTTGLPNQRATVDAVRSCLTRFSIATTATRDLLGLGQAYLAAKLDASADSAFAKLVSATAKDAMRPRAWTLYKIAQSYLRAAQPKFVDAERYMAQLDALGADAAPERMMAHYALAQGARVRDSIPLWERELSVARAASRMITGDLRKEYAPVSASVYVALSDLKARQNNVPSALAVLDTGEREIVPLRPSVQEDFKYARQRIEMQGKSAPPLQATLWANTGAAGNVRPVPGKVTLLIFLEPSQGDYMYETHAVVRRLVATYGARGLDVTYVVRTSGYFRRELVRPDTELVKIKWYYLDMLKLPVALAVWKAERDKRDDGRMMIRWAPNETAYHGWGPFLVDRTGVIRLVMPVSRDNEAIWDHVIESVL